MPNIMKNTETKNELGVNNISSMDKPKKVGLTIFFLIFGLSHHDLKFYPFQIQFLFLSLIFSF